MCGPASPEAATLQAGPLHLGACAPRRPLRACAVYAPAGKQAARRHDPRLAGGTGEYDAHPVRLRAAPEEGGAAIHVSAALGVGGGEGVSWRSQSARSISDRVGRQRGGLSLDLFKTCPTLLPASQGARLQLVLWCSCAPHTYVHRCTHADAHARLNYDATMHCTAPPLINNTHTCYVHTAPNAHHTKHTAA